MSSEKIIRADAAVEWRRLRPGKALETGSPEYAWRPEAWNGAVRLATLVTAQMGPLVVTGPPGSGKTTELAAMAAELGEKALTVHVMMERAPGDPELDVSRALVAIMQAVLKQLTQRELEPSETLRKVLSHIGEEAGQRREALEGLRRLVREARIKTRLRLVLVVDGLDKLPASLAQELGETLLPIAREASLIIIVAPSALLGPEAHGLLEAYRLTPIGAVPVLLDLAGTAPTDAWKFLSALALQKLGLQAWPENVDRYAYKAALCSAGIPRQYLQFLQDAVSFSMMAAHRRIMRGDMRVTYRQKHEAAIRLLRDGDLPAIERCKGTSGVELPLEARKRLFDMGLVLEYDNEGKTIVLPHPILTEYSLSPIVDSSFL